MYLIHMEAAIFEKSEVLLWVFLVTVVLVASLHAPINAKI